MKLTRKLRMEIVKTLRDASEWCCEADSASVLALVKIAQQIDVDDEPVWSSDVRAALQAQGWECDVIRSYGSEHWFLGERHIEIVWSGSKLEYTRYAPPDLLDGLLAEFDRASDAKPTQEDPDAHA